MRGLGSNFCGKEAGRSVVSPSCRECIYIAHRAKTCVQWSSFWKREERTRHDVILIYVFSRRTENTHEALVYHFGIGV